MRHLLAISLSWICLTVMSGEIVVQTAASPEKKIRFQLNGNWIEVPYEIIGTDPPPPPSDRDSDGIPDTEDECPDDAQNKCNEPPPPVDTDSDGIPDELDTCPTDPTNKCNEPPPSADSPTGYEPRVLWSKERQAVYSRMVVENHPLWLELRRNADLAVKGTPAYGDLGQYGTIAYQATGELKYARAAWPLVRQTLAIDPGTNAMMMYGAELAWCVEWLRPALTAEEIEEARRHFDRWALKSLGIGQPKYVGGFGHKLTDSDRVTGQYLSLVSYDRVFGTDYLSRRTEELASENYNVGGLTPTNTGTIRDAVLRYAVIAEGGVLNEATMYNLFTENFLIPGIVAAGSEHFPEYVALWKDMARYHIAEITPDLEENFRWGDNEERTLVNRRLNYRISVLWLLAGVLGDEPEGKWCRWMATALSTKHNTPPLWRAYWLMDPFQPAEEPPTVLSVDSKMGVYLRKTADELFGATFHPLTGVQHQPERWGDFGLYRGGEHVINRPLGYAGTWLRQEWGNNVMLCGLGAMDSRSHGATEEGMLWGETSGHYYPVGYYDRPPSFVRQCRREITRDGVNVVLRDVIDMDDPRKLPKYERYQYIERIRMEPAPLLALHFNCPVEPTIESHSVSWKTAKGSEVKIVWADDRQVVASNVTVPGQEWTGVGWRIVTIPKGYTGGPIDITTKVEVHQ